MDLVVPARVGRRAAALLVTEASIKAGCLERMGAQGHLGATTTPDLLLRRGKEPSAQPRPAMLALHPEQVNVATPTPRPPIQPREQVTAVPPDGDAQQPAERDPGRGNIEGVDLLAQAFPEPIIDIAHHERGVTHHRLLSWSPHASHSLTGRPGVRKHPAAKCPVCPASSGPWPASRGGHRAWRASESRFLSLNMRILRVRK